MALESLCHEQLPEVLRGEFLHILAVVVNLPCWSVTTCIHTPPYKRHKHAPTEMYRQTRTHTHVHRRQHMYTDGARNQAGVGEKTAAQQNSELVWSRSKRKDQNVVGRRRRAEQRETAAGKRGGRDGD